LLLLAGYVALFGWLAVKTSLAVPVAVLERASAGQALVRSWQLSTNNFWRMAGALVLAFLLSSVIANVLSLPFSLGALLTGLAEELPLATLLTVVLSFLGDRKSTRLNSSHVKISYAVFCLKKKIHNQETVGGRDVAYAAEASELL